MQLATAGRASASSRFGATTEPGSKARTPGSGMSYAAGARALSPRSLSAGRGAGPMRAATPLLHGEPPGAIDLDIDWYSQYGHLGNTSWTNCFDTVKDLAKDGGASVMGPTTNIQIATAEDAQTGAVTIDASKAQQGIAYIDAELEAGRPVAVGVSFYGGYTGNADDITDHFVLLDGRGADDEGRYFTYLEVGTTKKEVGTDPTANRFYVQPDGKLMKKGKYDDALGGGRGHLESDKGSVYVDEGGNRNKMYCYQAHYEVTQVRLNKENQTVPEAGN